jgi:hypothetical protein
MKVRTYIIMTRDEVQRNIPYAMICETRWGATWENSRRRRRWAAEFTERERDHAYDLFKMAYKWYLKTGVPEEVKMSTQTLVLWSKLAEFCASL